MSDQQIYLEKSHGRAQLVLNQPSKRNAVSAAMWRAIPELLDQAERDPDIKVLIVTGKNGAFAAGADISEFEDVYATRQSAEQYSRAIARALDGLAGFSKPTLARIEGACVGGGCGIALACDLRFAVKSSRYAITPAKLGLIYPLNDTKRLIDAVGVSQAKDILFTGRLIDADEAIKIGLIDQCVDDVSALDNLIDAYAGKLSEVSPFSARMTKQMIQMICSGTLQETEQSYQMFLDAFQGADFQEGYRAFLEKRKPEFKG